MRLTSPIDAVAGAVHHAAHFALPDTNYRCRNFEAYRAMAPKDAQEARRTDTFPMKDAVRRPNVDECEVHAMFSQLWGSTVLGFGGLGGAAMTPAYTVVVKGPDGHFVVYWGGRMAYLIDPTTQSEAQRDALEEDIAKRWTVNRREAVARYGCVKGDR